MMHYRATAGGGETYEAQAMAYEATAQKLADYLHRTQDHTRH